MNALRVPLYDLVSNWAYMVIAALAWNLESWFAMMLHHKADRRAYIAMEARRFLHQVILIPAMVIRRARSITIGDHRLPPRPGPIPQRRQHHRTHPLRLTPPRPLHSSPRHTQNTVVTASVPNQPTRVAPACPHTRTPHAQRRSSRSAAAHPPATTVQHPETGPTPSRYDIADNPKRPETGPQADSLI